MLDVSPPLLTLSMESSRKRRRETSNGGNTLDALVARNGCSNGEPLASRCLAENDAIESPDDLIEMKKMENDPDVSTRTCSLCGYQGKWVSEMIRHKRVHTNDRPFKCRYCSRTSKWKADLIRHVAKTHGIRVVSKYSRSKTLNESRSSFELSPKSLKDSSLSPRSLSNSPTPSHSYQCIICNFEQEALSQMISHLSNVHGLPPYSCDSCDCKMDSIEIAMTHTLSCPSSTIKSNLHTVYGTSLKVDTTPSNSISSISPLLLNSPMEGSVPSTSILPLLAPYFLLLNQLNSISPLSSFPLPTQPSPLSAFTPTTLDSFSSISRLQSLSQSSDLQISTDIIDVV
ncbi:ztf-2 [Pristionchus pacificus]|uniref:C2H2-type domain-containing protein n=1 Tax=Pristionchus pacificus TaxID=54126 RepID=A0A8R1V604_PRIPA|nr:ztf-2 [Pristionchus pacificus]